MVLCSNRLTRFCADRNLELAIWKLTATTTMASTTGSTPLSPPRTRSHQARRYWLSDWASSSGGTSTAAASGAAVRSTSVPTAAVCAGVSPALAVRSDTSHAPAPGQYVDEHRGQQHRAGQDVLQGRGQLAEVEQGHAVGDAADEEAAEHAVDGLAPAAEQADPADDGGGDGVQHELAGVGGVGAVLAVEERAEQDAAQRGGGRAQRERPGADRDQADPG